MAEIRVFIIPDRDSNHSKFTEWTGHSIVFNHRQSSHFIILDITPATFSNRGSNGLP